MFFIILNIIQLCGALQMGNQVTVMIPLDLRQRAGNLRINVSEVCRLALADEVSKVEKERGIAAKANTPNAKPIRTINREMEMQNEIGTKP